jgi:hypothetical protein
MPAGFGGIKTKGLSLFVMAHLKRSIVEVKSENSCLAHSLIIAIGKVTNDPNYNAYIQGRNIGPVVQQLLEPTGINLDNDGGIPELTRFLEHCHEL